MLSPAVCCIRLYGQRNKSCAQAYAQYFYYGRLLLVSENITHSPGLFLSIGIPQHNKEKKIFFLDSNFEE